MDFYKICKVTKEICKHCPTVRRVECNKDSVLAYKASNSFIGCWSKGTQVYEEVYEELNEKELATDEQIVKAILNCQEEKLITLYKYLIRNRDKDYIPPKKQDKWRDQLKPN